MTIIDAVKLVKRWLSRREPTEKEKRIAESSINIWDNGTGPKKKITGLRDRRP